AWRRAFPYKALIRLFSSRETPYWIREQSIASCVVRQHVGGTPVWRCSEPHVGERVSKKVVYLKVVYL
ncbi:MAG: hypothetical protein WBF93_02915, partial [Pirellulales bacterium]